LIHQDSIGETN